MIKLLKDVGKFVGNLYFVFAMCGIVAFSVVTDDSLSLRARVGGGLVTLLLSPFSLTLVTCVWVLERLEKPTSERKEKQP